MEFFVRIEYDTALFSPCLLVFCPLFGGLLSEVGGGSLLPAQEGGEGGRGEG